MHQNRASPFASDFYRKRGHIAGNSAVRTILTHFLRRRNRGSLAIFFAEEIAHLGASKIARFFGEQQKVAAATAENRAILAHSGANCRAKSHFQVRTSERNPIFIPQPAMKHSRSDHCHARMAGLKIARCSATLCIKLMAWGRGEEHLNMLKTTPTPNRNGSYGVEVGVRMP